MVENLARGHTEIKRPTRCRDSYNITGQQFIHTPITAG